MHRLLAFLVGCGAAAPAPQHPSGAPIGTAAPYSIIAMPEDGRWSVVCQARSDTDKDGKVAVFYQLHGEETGDAMLAYYRDPQGRESVVENVLAYTNRHVVVVDGGAPYLIDTRIGKREQLAGTLPEFRIAGGVHVWRFDPSGEHLLFFRDGAPTVRTLATGAETKIAPVAWSAEWSADGSWVELAVLDGDTNHDGFTHGPDLSPGEGIPGRDCGRKFDWVMAIDDLDPKSEHIDEAIASIENPDKLARRLWRLSDGFTVAGETAVDRDTIITRRDDGSLAIGSVGAAGAPLAHAGCSVAGVSPPLRAAIVTCPDGEQFELFWFKDGRRVRVARIDDDRGASVGAGLFEIGDLLGNMRTGEVLLRAKFVWLTWFDDTHAFVLSTDAVELRWADGRHMQLARKPDSNWMHAGRYFVYDKTRIDLTTGEKATIRDDGLRLRDDGAILLDGGPQKLAEGERGPRMGPLRWH